MADLRVDDDATRQALSDLCGVLSANGGIIGDDLTLESIDGEFRIRSGSSDSTAPVLLSLPRSCLPPAGALRLDLEGDAIVIASKDSQLSQVHRSIAETMIELFNRAGKIAMHATCATPLLYYRDRALFDIFMSGWGGGTPSFFQNINAMSESECTLATFVKSRTFGLKAGDSVSDQRFPVYLPVVDFINHHAMAPGFVPGFCPDVLAMGRECAIGAESTGVSVRLARSIEGSDECFVSYGPYDARDMLLHYSFVDHSNPFVRSVRIRIDFPDSSGALEIRSGPRRKSGEQVPENMEGLLFAPGISRPSDGVVTMSFLFIPPQAMLWSMREILALAIRRLGFPENRISELTKYAERQVLKENQKYYQSLLEYISSVEAEPRTEVIRENIAELSRLQLGRIGEYERQVDLNEGGSRAGVK